MCQLVEEMFLSMGHRFATFAEVTKVVKKMHSTWVCRCVPAILEYSEELGMLPPENHEENSECFSQYSLHIKFRGVLTLHYAVIEGEGDIPLNS